MVRDELFEIEGNRIVLKDRGEEKARELVQRHRLTERFFSELFEMSEEEVEEEYACRKRFRIKSLPISPPALLWEHLCMSCGIRDTRSLRSQKVPSG